MIVENAVSAGIARVLAGEKIRHVAKDLYQNPQLSELIEYEGLRQRIGRRVEKIKLSGGHTALLAECEEVGIPIEDVKYFWHKSKKFSINAVNGKTNHVDEFNRYLDMVRTDINSEFQWAKVKAFTEKPDGVLFVPCIFDLHLGKLAWGEETGEDYDMKIAEARFVTAIEDLIRKTSGHRISRILFPIGNDIYNSDKATPFAQTTSGTPQQDDSRWQKMFRTGTKLITWAVSRLAEIAPVDVVTVFSNHDHERVFYLGEVINAVYAEHPNVSVDNSPKVRKYYKYGQCLFGLAHGHNEKAMSLPFTMAQEAKQDWADTHYREWFLGHLHHSKKIITEVGKDYSGVKVTYLTSPSATDAWHFAKNFTGSIKGCEAFVYDKQEGLIGTAVHNIF